MAPISWNKARSQGAISFSALDPSALDHARFNLGTILSLDNPSAMRLCYCANFNQDGQARCVWQCMGAGHDAVGCVAAAKLETNSTIRFCSCAWVSAGATCSPEKMRVIVVCFSLCSILKGCWTGWFADGLKRLNGRWIHGHGILNLGLRALSWARFIEEWNSQIGSTYHGGFSTWTVQVPLFVLFL